MGKSRSRKRRRQRQSAPSGSQPRTRRNRKFAHKRPHALVHSGWEKPRGKARTSGSARKPTRRAAASAAKLQPEALVASERTGSPRKLDYVAAPKLHSPASSPRAQCKERPLSNASRGGGSRAYVQWCDRTYKTKKRR
ncbi:hypothetical protein [Microviridae sp.]|nr:hypothetical protein [Microviridae sp.]